MRPHVPELPRAFAACSCCADVSTLARILHCYQSGSNDTSKRIVPAPNPRPLVLVRILEIRCNVDTQDLETLLMNFADEKKCSAWGVEVEVGV